MEISKPVDPQRSLISQTPEPSGQKTSTWVQLPGLLHRGWRSMRPRNATEAKNLESFSKEQQQEILLKREILSSLAYFIGKDFRLPVHLGAPGSGWFWDPQKNAVTIDSADVLQNPLSFLRFVTCHEGAHRRISRLSQAPGDLLEKPGFMMLLNGVEDPRVNNYICDAYPIIERDMQEALSFSLEKIDSVRKAALRERGFVPHSVTAIIEIIREWFEERTGIKSGAPSTLSPEVRRFLDATRPACQRAYFTYPLRRETEDGEGAAFAYSKAAYRVIAEEIWPRFEKLLQEDRKGALGAEAFKEMADSARRAGAQAAGRPQKAEAKEGTQEREREPHDGARTQGATSEKQERAPKETEGGKETKGKESESEGRDAGSQEGRQGENGEQSESSAKEKAKAESRAGASQGGSPPQSGGGSAGADGIRSEIEGALSSSARKEVRKALQDIEEDARAGKEVHSGEHYERLSKETKEELERYAERLPDGEREALRERARQFIEKIQGEVADQLEGQLTMTPHQEEEVRAFIGDREISEATLGASGRGAVRVDMLDGEEFKGFRSKIRAVFQSDGDTYDAHRRGVLEVVNHLERDLRKLFQERRDSALEEGKRYGPGLDLDHRISECAAGVSAADTRSFTRRTRPLEKDYAISLLVDLSGSMRHGNRMTETFKATIALAEVLNRLGINFEIVGFNDSLHEYKVFWKRMGPEIREKMGSMLQEIHTPRAQYNDDGWALTVASERLRKEKHACKFLIVLSDGLPEPSGPHATPQYELSKVVKDIRTRGDQILIGLGVGEGTAHVARYYPNSCANISANELPEKLAEILERAIRHPEEFIR